MFHTGSVTHNNVGVFCDGFPQICQCFEPIIGIIITFYDSKCIGKYISQTLASGKGWGNVARAIYVFGRDIPVLLPASQQTNHQIEILAWFMMSRSLKNVPSFVLPPPTVSTREAYVKYNVGVFFE
jgi:hypothetical protein